MSAPAAYARLVEAASRPYRAAGPYAWHFARGKLVHDPVYRYVAEASLIPEGTRVLDLGCGQGLLAALLVAADGTRLRAYRGIEASRRDVERAHCALGADCGVEQGDIRQAIYGVADVVVILDVLHYMPASDQDAVLARTRAALAPGGALLLRVGDAAGGARFLLSRWIDRGVALARGRGGAKLHARSVAQWRSALEALDFRVRAEPMSRGTPFANVLLIAQLARRA